jgi:hypothetical protein
MAQGSNNESHGDALDALAAMSRGDAPAPAKPPAQKPLPPKTPPAKPPASTSDAKPAPQRAPAPVTKTAQIASKPPAAAPKPPVPRAPAPPAQPPKAIKPPAPDVANDPLAALAAAGSSPQTDESCDDDTVESSDQPVAPEPESPISASGFVGMLAKGKLNESDPELSSPSPERDEETLRRREKPKIAKAIEGETAGNLRDAPRKTLAVPLPRSADEIAQAKAPRQNNLNKIALAREVELTEAVDTEQASGGNDSGDDFESPTAPEPARSSKSSTSKAPRRGPVQAVPSWWKGALPVMFTLTGLLTLIGLWAVGAIIAMAANFQNYPLIEFNADDGVFTSGSKMMAGAMVAALPIALIIGILALMMSRQIRRAERQ